MADGKLQAVCVTGPGGQPVVGQPVSSQLAAKGGGWKGKREKAVGTPVAPAVKLTAGGKERVRKPLPPGAFPTKKK
eukprot:6781559-Prymnesium_polylepis.1